MAEHELGADLRPSARAIVAGILIVVAALVAAVAVRGSGAFQEAFLANLAATLVGLLAGVPFALLLVRWQMVRQATSERAESLRRRRAVLEAIRGELTDNLADLADRREPDGTRVIKTPALGVEVWRAMADGGELRHVDDVVLLRQLARAYRFVGQTRFLEEQGIRTMQSNGWTAMLARLDKPDEVTKAAMDEAVAAIDAAMAPAQAVRR